jgi:hypothetical protein
MRYAMQNRFAFTRRQTPVAMVVVLHKRRLSPFSRNPALRIEMPEPAGLLQGETICEP